MATYIAENLASTMKEISVAEFFERNKHILGYDNQQRALITSIKEAVDNALDACEEAGILPYIEVSLIKKERDEFILKVTDNGPGIVLEQIPHVFGRLLYGSRFHAIRQSRGQQGIGISAVVMYSQLTTGNHAKIVSKIGADAPAHRLELAIDVKKNRSQVIKTKEIEWDRDHGTSIEVRQKGRYQEGRQSVLEYLRQTAIVNPHATIIFQDPKGDDHNFIAVTEKLPPKTEEIRPHPHGVEIGQLIKMLRATGTKRIETFLVCEFTRISYTVARRILNNARVDLDCRPQDICRLQAVRILESMNDVKVRDPPKNCLSPIGELLIKKGLKKEIDSKFSATVTRPPRASDGHPFLVEAGIVYGGDLPKDDTVSILRFANKVPLLYQQGGCIATRALESINWRQYGLDQRGGRGIPSGPATILVHVASTNVPFTSEAKEALADVPTIREEVELALRECGRMLKGHINKKAKLKKAQEKFSIIQEILPLIAEKSAKLLNAPEPNIHPIVTRIMNLLWVEQGKVGWDRKTKQTIIPMTIVNYTERFAPITLYFKTIDGRYVDIGIDEETDHEVRLERGWTIVELRNLRPAKREEIRIFFEDLERGDLDDVEIFYDGFKGNILGAEPLDRQMFKESIRLAELGDEEDDDDVTDVATCDVDDDDGPSDNDAADTEEGDV